MRRIALIAWLASYSAAVWGASPPPLVYDIQALAAWQPLTKSETVPYQAEGLGSQLLFSARSRQDSYAFITRIDNTVRRPALIAEEVEALISAESYAALSPIAFRTELGSTALTEGRDLRCVVSSFRTGKLDYEVGAGAGEVLVKTVFLPVVLWDRDGESYSNSLYVANFRGDPKNIQDLADFDRMWSRVSIPESFTLVEIPRFNALQPELAAKGDSTAAAEKPETSRGAIPSAADGPQGEGEDTAVLAAGLVDLIAGRETEAARRRLRATAQAHPGTVLAEVISSLEAARTFELQRAVWVKALALAETAAKARLVALFLSQSIGLEDWRAAETLASDATAASVSLASLDSEDLELVLDSLLHLESDAPSSPSLRQFLALQDQVVLDRLSALLAMKGLAVPDIAELAERDRKGAWRLKSPRAKGNGPWLAIESNKLVVLRPGSETRNAALEPEDVTHLLRVAEILHE